MCRCRGKRILQIRDFIWLEDVSAKITSKHRVWEEEVEEVFCGKPRYRWARRGKFKGEDVYYAYGQAESGRYLFVVFIYMANKDALILSARDMNTKDKMYYAKK